MATTPSPRARIHTPPTPLHGAKHDSWEPYSPRRSSRVAAQRSKQVLRSPQHRPVRASTPKRNSHKARTSQAFSPPSSPASPHATPSLPVSKTRKQADSSPYRTRPSRLDSPAISDFESGRNGANPSHLRPTVTDAFGMLPTPAKTPRKRDAAKNATLKSTARILFPGRPATVDEVMPSPRKARKGKMQDLSIGGLVEEGDDEASAGGIPIYTDSKERVPSVGTEDDNPFLSKNAGGKKKAMGDSRPVRTKAKKSRREVEMEKAAKNDEGIIYVFRGKKVLRRFDDGGVEIEDTMSDLEIRRRAGHASNRPFTRSSFKPRLLFPSEEHRRAREAADEADEEAVTDIEVPHPSSTNKRTRGLLAAMESEPRPEVVTPVEQQFESPNTPPSSGRPKRSSRKTGQREEAIEAPTGEAPAHKKAKKPSPFSSWPRTKAGSSSSASKGTKRGGEPIERGVATNKRSKSGQQAPT